MVKDANVLALVLKMFVLGEPDGGGKVGEGRGNEFMVGKICAELSDWNDCDLGPMGIVRFLRADWLLLSDVILLAS